MKKLLACALVAMAGCPNITVDPDETEGSSNLPPVVEFDPAASLATGARFIPFPNDLARNPETGLVNLGPQACESATSMATRVGILNTLDGFGTYETAMQVTFTAEVDESTLAGNVVMYQLTNVGSPDDPANAVAIPLVMRKGTTLRFLPDKCSMPDTVNAVAFVPMVPLKQKSTYVVALNKGIKDTTGKDFTGSVTWGLVSAAHDPVTLDDNGLIVGNRTPLDPADPAQRAQIMSLDTLWKFHAPGLTFLASVPNARPRSDVLVAFQFTTQTTTDQLNPAVVDSPAAALSSIGLLSVSSVTGKFGPFAAICANSDGVPPNAPAEANPTQCFLKLALGGCSPLTTGCGQANFNLGSNSCGALGCQNVGDVLGGGLATTGYLVLGPNPLAGGAEVPGAWTNPIHPEAQTSPILETLITIPAGPPPSTGVGYPTVIFGHGLGSSKEAVFAIASSLSAAGYAVVAIDSSAHGSRAVRISKDPALGCIGHCALNNVATSTECDTIAECGPNETCGVPTMSSAPPTPTTAPQCYAPFLSTNLAATRDGIRQTVLDLLRLTKALKTCGNAGCGALKVDPGKIYYLGQSLGSLIGTTAVGTSPDLRVSVLNVGGVGWADILENTDSLTIRCTLVDSLITAGILVGEKWNGSLSAPTGLCSTDAWKAQPGFQTFAATLRWVIDPADGANFATFTAAKRVLLQEVVNDQVVPNIATNRQGALFGLSPQAGDPFQVPGQINASTAITTSPMTNKFLTYTTTATNTFDHPSLLRPSPGPGGPLGTARLQKDAITFLFLNP